MGGGTTLWWMDSEGRSALETWLRDQVGELRLADGVIEAFVNDLRTYFSQRNPPRLQPDGGRRGQPPPTGAEPDLVSRFLLSTDLFLHGDETRELRYVGLHDPYISPCLNPLSKGR